MAMYSASQRQSIASRIRELRENRYGDEQGARIKCAKNVGVTPSVWSDWETGQRVPQDQNIAKIAHHFGVTADYILGMSGAGDARESPTPDQLMVLAMIRCMAEMTAGLTQVVSDREKCCQVSRKVKGFLKRLQEAQEDILHESA